MKYLKQIKITANAFGISFSSISAFKPKNQLAWLKIGAVLEIHFLMYRAEGPEFGDFFHHFLLEFFSFTLPESRCWERLTYRGNGDKLNLLRLKLRDGSFSSHRTRLYLSASVFCTHLKSRQKRKNYALFLFSLLF